MRPLPPGEVHVWVADLAAPAGEEALAADERARAARFVFPADRRRFAAAHAALRQVLGLYLGKAPESLVFTAGPRGKPSLAEAGDAWLRFNLAHSRDAALIACARGREVGADIEWMRDDFDHAEIAARYFSPAERTEWEGLAAAERPAAFFRGWTCKEAYVKALGEGLGHPSTGYTVRLAAAEPAALLDDAGRPGGASAWSLRAVPAPSGYAAAIAVAGPDPPVALLRWPADIS